MKSEIGLSSNRSRFRRAAKNVLYWTVPQGLLTVARSIHYSPYRLTSEEQEILSRNDIFRDKYVGRRCFVIGNGPSLAHQDLTPLADEVTIAMNLFFKHPILQVWQPTFYCAADPVDSYTSRHRERMRTGFGSVDADAFFFHIEARGLVEKDGWVSPDSAHYFKPALHWADWPLNPPPWDLTGPVPSVPSTANLAILLALYVGCDPIYLIGLDSDWLAHRSVNRHFYGPDNEDYGGSDDLGTHLYKDQINGALRTWESYEAALRAAHQVGRRIFNATEGGFLDVFPRVHFEELFGGGEQGEGDRFREPQVSPAVDFPINSDKQKS